MLVDARVELFSTFLRAFAACPRATEDNACLDRGGGACFFLLAMIVVIVVVVVRATTTRSSLCCCGGGVVFAVVGALRTCIITARTAERELLTRSTHILLPPLLRCVHHRQN